MTDNGIKIWISILLVLLVSVGLSACNKDTTNEEPAAVSTAAPPADASRQGGPAVAGGAAVPTAEPATPPEDGGADAGVAESTPGTETGEAGSAETDAEAGEDGTAPSDDGAAEPGADTEAAADDDGAAAEPGAADTEAEGAAAAGTPDETDLLPVSAAELTNEEKIENFRNLDPREIIIAKYDDLAERIVVPWDPEDPTHFIPQTGRYDPLTPVDDEIPDELKPDRGGGTDQNEIDTYLIAQECTIAVRQLGAAISVLNVIQIGSEKMATISLNGQRATVGEGQGFNFNVSQYGSIPIVARITVGSINPDQVSVMISASGQGTSTSISHTKIFIPKN